MKNITVKAKLIKGNKNNKNINYLGSISLNSKKEEVLLNKYLIYENDLETQAIRNSFGKMINARNITNPKYSFGKEERFPNISPKKSLSYISQIENNSNEINKSKSISKRLTLNDYENNNSSYIIKYSRPPKWAFSKAERVNNTKINKYDYYNSPMDYENKNKIWDSHIIGGNIGIEPRFSDGKNFIKDAQRPGPGGYNPNIELYKYKRNNYGYMGIKTEVKKDKDKDKNNIGKKFYNVNCQIGSNINNYKFSNSPSYIFGTSIRDLQKKNRGFKINDRYLKYSAFGEQIMAQKNSRPIYSFGKQERFNKFK